MINPAFLKGIIKAKFPKGIGVVFRYWETENHDIELDNKKIDIMLFNNLNNDIIFEKSLAEIVKEINE